MASEKITRVHCWALGVGHSISGNGKLVAAVTRFWLQASPHCLLRKLLYWIMMAAEGLGGAPFTDALPALIDSFFLSPALCFGGGDVAGEGGGDVRAMMGVWKWVEVKRRALGNDECWCRKRRNGHTGSGIECCCSNFFFAQMSTAKGDISKEKSQSQKRSERLESGTWMRM